MDVLGGTFNLKFETKFSKLLYIPLCELPVGDELKPAALIPFVSEILNGDDLVPVSGFLIIVFVFDQIDLMTAVVCKLFCLNCFTVNLHWTNIIEVLGGTFNCYLE